ncbi:MAG: PAS domain-containing sensor histidine kinase [Candidatus Hodarchaeales archaeon]
MVFYHKKSLSEFFRKMSLDSDLFKAIFMNLPLGIGFLDTDLAWIGYNRALCELLGYNLSELNNLTYYDVIHTEELKDFKLILKKMFNGDISWIKSEKRYQKKNGELLWVNETFSLISYEDRYFLVVVDDVHQKVTQREELQYQIIQHGKSLANEKKKIEAIIDNLPDGIIVFEEDTSIYLVNKKFKETYSRIYQKKLPETLHDFLILGNPFGNTVAMLFYQKERKKVTIEPIPGLFLRFTSVPLDDGSTSVSIIIFQDISSFVENEKLRKQFVSAVSHELRTPITTINLSLQNLQKYRDKLTEQQQDTIIDMMSDSVSILTQMIEDLLIASRIEAGKLELYWSNFKLLTVVKKVLNMLEPISSSKNITINVDVDPNIEIYADEKRISQVLRILVDNAIKYSPDNSKIEIIAQDHYRGTFNPKILDGTLIQVKDNGRGIKEEDIPNIFDMFYRSKDVANIKGSGIGLNIAQELVSLHHGGIFVESTYGKGSTFSIFLPRLNKSIEEGDET